MVVQGLSSEMENFAFLIAAAALVIAAIQDARVRIIPDTCVVVVAICGLALNAGQGWQSLGFALAASLAVLAVMVVLFHYRLVGGGDAKLIPAASLLFSAAQVPAFLFHTAIAGGVLSLIVLVGGFMRTIFAARWPQRPNADSGDGVSEFGFQGHGLPYGIAILAGVVATWALRA